MTFLPIVARELRVAARLPGTYWARSGAGAALMAGAAFLFLTLSRESSYTVSRALFYLLSGGVALYCLLRGIWSTADCLSQEKREGTLGLLFLTDLKGYDVVLGKLAATSLNGFYGVLAAVPVLSLPLLLGGVTPAEVWRMAILAANTLFFSLAVGLFASALSRSAWKAVALTIALLLFFTVILPVCGTWLVMVGRADRLSWPWFVSSIAYSYYWALDSNYPLEPAQFGISMGVIHGLGWMFLGLACLIVPHAWQVRAPGARAMRWRERWRAWSYGDQRQRDAFRQQLLGGGAYFWLAARERLKPALVWASLALIACGWVWGLARAHEDWLNEATYVLTGLLLNSLLKVWFGFEAGRQLAEDRRDGALELLLSTPLSIREMLRGQRLALQRQFQGAVLLVLGAFVLFLVAGLRETPAMEDSEARWSWMLLWVGGMLMLVADLVALHWVGLWQGLIARNPLRAASNSLVCVLLLPWAILALLMLLASFLWPRIEGEPGVYFFLGGWLLVGLGVDLVLGLSARRKLLTEFRLAAARRFEPKAGFWKRLSQLMVSPRGGARDGPLPEQRGASGQSP